MSRSIHDTWGVLGRAKQADWSDPDVPKAIEADMRKNLRRQQALRTGALRIRRAGELALQPVHPDTLPIFVDDEGPYIVHSATEEDIRAVLRRLPPGSLDGLQAIRQCVDHADPRYEPRVRDPFTGRLRHELIPGVYVSSTAGDYTRATATIRLLAYVCDPEALGPFAILLKMKVLRTLVHEVAHHFDYAFRKQRNRWDVRDKNEEWAERIEGEHGEQIVTPYIAERYSSECRELRSWIKDHGGAPLSPLVVLADDEHRHATARDALLRLVRLVRSGQGGDGARVTFARDLHACGENDHARTAVQRVLSRRPEDAAALAVSACIVQCEGKDHKAAEALCRRAIAADPACVQAWTVLARGQAIQKKWEGAAHACERALALLSPGTHGGWYLLSTLAESHLNLVDIPGLHEDVARMRAWGTELSVQGAEVHLCIAHCWSEEWEEALRLASKLFPTMEPGDLWHRWLAAAQFESAHRLGLSNRAGSFDEAAMTELESNDFAKVWMLRIREHVNTVPAR
ncbi:MAG: hypothetical protein ABJE95_10990 [Byssovorax sp.]